VNKRAWILIFVFLLGLQFLPGVYAAPRLIANSADWKDVYSVMLFGSLKNYNANFLTSTSHAKLMVNQIPRDVEEIRIYSSIRNPFVNNYQSILMSDGFDNVVEIRSNEFNLDLLEELPEITRFIIIDPSYGYNAVSVAPFAVLGNYYVLFVDETNLPRVDAALSDRTVEEMILYGILDRTVRERFAKYDPIIINTGDRFDDNIEITKMYQELHEELKGGPRKQVLLTNGEFIEASFFTGVDPVLFIGYSNVPQQVRDYIETSAFEVGTLIGNELIGTATFVKRQTGLSVFVKFGQGARAPTGPVASVEDLDRFPLPVYNLNIDVIAATINTATAQLEITYHNLAEIGSYFQNILIRLNLDEESYVIPDDSDPTFIDGNSFKTIVFDLKDAEGNDIPFQGSDNITLDISIIYGESAKSLEQTLEKTLVVEKVNVMDEASIELLEVVYSKRDKGFYIKVKNIGEVDAYAAAEIFDLYVNTQYGVYGSEKTIFLEKGKSGEIFVPVELAEEDIANNEKINVRVLYGQRETALIKSIISMFEFKYSSPDFAVYVLIALVVILLLLILPKKKCKNCGYKNPILRKTCKKCKQPLR